MIKRLKSALYVPVVSGLVKSAATIPVKLLILVASLVAATSTYAQASAAAEFSATIEQRFAPTDQLLNRAKVFVNAQGYRVEQRVGLTDHVLIANIANSSLWLIDKGRSLAHQVPLVEVSTASVLPTAQEALVQLPGYINSIPCLDLNGKLVGDVQHGGRTLELWHCASVPTALMAVDAPSDLPDRQYYSPSLKLVLYSRSRYGIETEVVDIVEHPVDEQLMSPPAQVKFVSYEEFMDLKPSLSHYNAGS